MAASGGNYVMDGFIMFLDYLATFDHVYLVTVSKVRLIVFEHEIRITNTIHRLKLGHRVDEESFDT